MFPVLPILFIAAARANRGKPRTSTQSERVVAVLWWALILPSLLLFAAALWVSGQVLLQIAVVLGCLCLPVVSFPWAITRFVLIPRGAYKLATRLTTWSMWVWGGDREGAAIAAGAAALSRHTRLGPEERKEAFAWLDARVQKVKTAHAGMLLAQSVLARTRGDVERADRLLRAIAWMPDEITPVPLRALATELVVGDALVAGDVVLARKLTRASGARAGGSTGAKLVVACAEALAPPEKPRGALARWWARLEIRSLALRARPRHAWRRIVDDALAALSAKAAATAAADAKGTAPAPLDEAGLTKAQAAVLWSALARRAGGALSEGDRARVTGAIDDAAFSLNHEIAGDLALVDDATNALADVLRAAASSWTPAQKKALASSTLARAESNATGALDELHAICDGLPRPEPLPPAAELEDWARVRLLYDRALAEAGDDLAMGPYEAVRDPLWNHSARIFNKGQKGVGRAIFAFLLAEALKRRDEPAIKGMRKNLAAQ